MTFDGARPGERVLSDLRANRDDPWMFGALTGSAVGISKESAFLPMVEDLEARLAPEASMLVLVGETQPLDGFAAAVAGRLRSRSGCIARGGARSAKDAYG